MIVLHERSSKNVEQWITIYHLCEASRVVNKSTSEFVTVNRQMSSRTTTRRQLGDLVGLEAR